MLSETDQYLHFICSLLSNIQHFFIILNASFCLPLSCFCLQRDGPLKVMKPFKNIKNINHNLLAQLGWSPLTGKKTCPQESLMSGTVLFIVQIILGHCYIINIPQPADPFLYLSFASVQWYSPTAVTILVAHHVLCGTPQLSCLTQSKNTNIQNCWVQEKTNFEYQPIHWEEGEIQGDTTISSIPYSLGCHPSIVLDCHQLSPNKTSAKYRSQDTSTTQTLWPLVIFESPLKGKHFFRYCLH